LFITVPREKQKRLMAFSVAMHNFFANGDPRSIAFLERVTERAPYVNEATIDISSFCKNDDECKAFYMLVGAVLPMRRGNLLPDSPMGPDTREVVDRATIDLLRTLCDRLGLVFATFVVPHFRIEGHDFERCIYRVVWHGLDGALQCDPMSGKARYWLRSSTGNMVGRPPIRQFYISERPPPHYFVGAGTSEFNYSFDAATGLITLKDDNGVVVDELKEEGIDLVSTLNNKQVRWRNETPHNVRGAPPAAPAIANIADAISIGNAVQAQLAAAAPTPPVN
jgi:hypothetical protein